MGLKRNILRVFSANFLSMISGVLIGFIVPAVLSVDGYSNLKTYTFYISYIGFLHLGFIDGMYIKYGGKSINDINKEEFKLEHTIFIISQFVATLIFLILAFVKKDIIIFFIAISIIPINSLSFYKLFYQSIGEFKIYANISYIYTIVYLILNILLAIIIKSTDYKLYCLAGIIANIIVFVYLEYSYFKVFSAIKIKYTKKVWENIKVGFFILLGNLAVVLFYGLDRWFIKVFYSVNDFAYYSFAVSMLNVINVLIGAISVTFYNYLVKEEIEENIKKLKKYLIVVGCFASFGFFVLSGIVNIILKKYIPSLDIIAISFAAYPYMIIINALFINLYKSRKKEKKYLKVVIFMLLISFIYNSIAKIISNNPVSIAMATTIAFITWYIYSSTDFKYLKSDLQESIFLLINLISFILCAHYLNWIIGGSIYLIIIVITSMIFLKKEFKELIKIKK